MAISTRSAINKLAFVCLLWGAPHNRHTNASLLIAQDVDIVTVGRRLGHASPTITMKIYSHALRRPDQEAAEKLENRLIKKKNIQTEKQA